jgi:hypothetical protein
LSSSRAIVKTFQMIGGVQGVSGSMAANILSEPTVLDKIDQVCLQVQWTSSNAIGTISVEASVDGNNGLYLINLALTPFMYIRVRYTRTSGTGTMSVKLSAKGN